MIFMASSVNKINMTRNRIAVHPFGYKKIKPSKKSYGNPFHMVQHIEIKLDHNAKVIKNIIHDMNNKPRKARTLADMVYEAYKA